MFLTSIAIEGYRGFKECGVLHLAQPVDNLYGSGLTVITGPNNSGKSSIIECLRARVGHTSPSFTTGSRNSESDFVKISYVSQGGTETLSSRAKGSSETVRTNVKADLSIYVLPSRRAFEAYFGKNEMSRESYLSNNPLPVLRSSVIANFASRLFKVNTAPDDFNNVLEKALGFGQKWAIDQSDQGSYFLKFYSGKHSHSSDGMGEGIVSVFAIVDSLYDSKPGDIIVIDEPELSLHPSLQKRIAKLIAEYARDRQIIISTHSPYFVDLKWLANGSNLARVVSTDSGTTIFELSKKSKDALVKLSTNNLFNPHVFGLDARELFFLEEQIILTEGQEDVLLYPKIADELGVDISGTFYGWGAGGAGNIGHLCGVLEDLGFQKVVALLDGNKSDEAIDLRNQYPKFLFKTISADDIRTKKARAATPPVTGILDADSKVRPEHLDSMKALFSELSTFMNAPTKQRTRWFSRTAE